MLAPAQFDAVGSQCVSLAIQDDARVADQRGSVVVGVEPCGLIVFEAIEDATTVGIDRAEQPMALSDDGACGDCLVELVGCRITVELDVMGAEGARREDSGDLEDQQRTELGLKREIARVGDAELHEAS
jgi:hypothetical protein